MKMKTKGKQKGEKKKWKNVCDATNQLATFN